MTLKHKTVYFKYFYYYFQYRDRRMPLSVDGGTTLQKELARVGCHTSKDAESYQEIMQMQADGVPNNIRRGDIPIMHSDCDGKINYN